MKSFLIVFCLVLGSVSGLPWIPEPQTQQDWMAWNWQERFEANVNNTVVNGRTINLLFYGDSITEGWDYTGTAVWNTYYAPFGAANYGIGGDRTEHVLWRAINGETNTLMPKICILKIGTNNVGFHSEEDIARGITTIVTELRGRIPTMKVLVLGILPRNNAETTELVERINARVSILDNGNTVRYLNMRDAYYAGNGQFYTELFTDDMLHLSPAGYEKWQMTMNDLLQEMWNSS